MAAPAYTTDLSTFDLAEASTAWAEPTATGWTYGAAPGTADTENVVQGTYSVPKAFNATGVGGMMANYGSGPTIPTDGAMLFWHFWASPACLDTEVNGGIRAAIGSALNAFKGWILGGKDTYTYGGWVNYAVDPTVSADYTVGSPTNYQYAGICVNNLNAITKGSPFVHDAIRFGRCELRVNGGESANYATFAGMAAKNDANNATDGYNRWGLFQAIMGVYLWKGLMTLGYSSVVDFRDSNRAILVDNTKKVGANFNKIEIKQSGSRVDWTGISISALGTVSKGRLEVVDDADVNFDSNTFTDMDTFIFKGNSTILKTIFRRCGLVTQNGAVFDGCTFDKPSGAVGLLSDDLNDIDNTTFVSDGSGHAIELTSAHAGTSKTLTNVFFSGYGAAGSTDAAIYNNSGGAVTITISGGDTPTVKNGTGASTTLVSGAVTVKVTAKKADGTNIQSARVLLKASAAGGPFPYDVTVTIVNSGTTATVTHTAHGMDTNDKVLILGASHLQNNGVHTITKIDADSYSYTMSSAPGSNPTGTIKATFVAIEGLTDSNGEISVSRVYASAQAVNGWVRKASSSPYYKDGVLSGSVSASTGFTATAILVADEG